MISTASWLRRRALIEMRRVMQWHAAIELRGNRALWSALQDYIRQSKSTGCNGTDYWMLYRLIRRVKPREILECGTGVSTLVIAHALFENHAEGAPRGRVTSMEEANEWLDMSKRLLPDSYRPYVDFCHSPTVEDYFSLFRGVRYRDVPERPYNFVFVDGPKYRSPLDGHPTFDFDFLHVLKRSDCPVAGLVDKRVSTCFALQQILGSGIVRYSPVLGLGIIRPCTRSDLGSLADTLSSGNFEDSFAVLGTTKLLLTRNAVDRHLPTVKHGAERDVRMT